MTQPRTLDAVAKGGRLGTVHGPRAGKRRRRRRLPRNDL